VLSLLFPIRDVAYPAFSGHLSGHRKWNADATTIEVKEDQSGELVCILYDKNDKSPPTSSEIPSTTSIFMKWFHFCNAVGDMGPLVVIVCIKNMPKEEFFAKKVKRLSNLKPQLTKLWNNKNEQNGKKKKKQQEEKKQKEYEDAIIYLEQRFLSASSEPDDMMHQEDSLLEESNDQIEEEEEPDE
jgi:hypothetical protein